MKSKCYPWIGFARLSETCENWVKKIMLISLPHALVLLGYYKYWLIFPIMVLEGPIITVISGFLVSLGTLNAFVAYPLLVFGDLLGDILHYWIGKYWMRFVWVRKIANFLGYDERREQELANHFQKHTVKTLLLAKISHGVGTVVQIAAGMAQMDFWRFVFWNFVGILPKTLLLLLLGYYLGNSYIKIDTYFDGIATVTISIVVLLAISLIVKRMIKNKISAE